MPKISIIFGTDTGNTRRIAKHIYKILGPDKAEKPVNISKLSIDEFLTFEHMILGTPTYGMGILPGMETGTLQPSWAEFVEKLDQVDLTGKKIALYGLGDQEKYPDNFVDGLYKLYQPLHDNGAEIIGHWPNEGYNFNASEAHIDNQFVGLPLDMDNQKEHTDQRVEQWLTKVLEQGLG